MVDTNSRRDFEEWKGGEEGLGDRQRHASPPLHKKRPSGARPFTGRSSPRDGFRLEGTHGQDGEGSMVPPAERERKRGSSDDGDSGRRSDGAGTPGDLDRKNWRNVATEKELHTLKDSDDSASILRTRSFNDECGYANGGKGRGRQESDAESVRIVAESFVDNVFGGLSSPAPLKPL